MRKRNSLTITLFIVFASSVAVSVTRLSSSGQNQHPTPGKNESLGKKISKVKNEQEWNELLNRLPAADFNATAPDDGDKHADRTARSRRFDGRNFGIKDPDRSITLTERFDEGKRTEALPVVESDVIVIGEVQDARAHLSNDKTGVYTEFTVSVNELLKNSGPAQMSQGSVFTAFREGGVVRYPGGHRRLYLVTGKGLPLGAGRYVLFLKASGEAGDYNVLTMYQLTADGVTPVDHARQFEPFGGQDERSFLQAIREELARSLGTAK